ncbi:MAG: hypothetical protein M1834_006487 [Cirrosporium novae-zelandiae]|nr:MAG: hypothetical protein M1834_006487 [Cirrosporium novae-zelandiae]
MLEEKAEELLQAPSSPKDLDLERLPSVYQPLNTFNLPKGEQKHYKQQYGDMYFLRLAKLKPIVEEIAEKAWEGSEIAGAKARKVERVLDVRQGELCWVAGTVYMDMPLKPNILNDIAKDQWIAAPPPRDKYFSTDGSDTIMLEDESGRLQLTGAFLKTTMLVTGCIIAVIGTENSQGEFEVVDIRVPDLPPQPKRWERDTSNSKPRTQKASRLRNKIALISGLSITGADDDLLPLNLLTEYLLGEAGGTSDSESASQISRLIIAGGCISPAVPLVHLDPDHETHHKKYGYDASAYNPAPITHLDDFLSEILPSIPVTLLPGENDPANASLPQQGLHPAMFSHAKAYVAQPGSGEHGWFDSVTNPWEGDIDGWQIMGNGGQPIDDMYKYLEGDDRIGMIECLLRWNCAAPTAPDTLWCYPFQDIDPFVISSCPHIFFVGNQPHFDTHRIHGREGQQVRLIAIPKFRDTGEMVLLDMESLEVEVAKIEVFEGLDAGVKKEEEEAKNESGGGSGDEMVQ